MSDYGVCSVALDVAERKFLSKKLNRFTIDEWLQSNGFAEDELEDLETVGEYSLIEGLLVVEYEDSEWYLIGERLCKTRSRPIFTSALNEYGSVSIRVLGIDGQVRELSFEQEGEEIESEQYQKELLASYEKIKASVPEEILNLEDIALIDDILNAYRDAVF